MNPTLVIPPAPPEPFDPAGLPLDGWWRTNYIGSSLSTIPPYPWEGTKSAGLSGDPLRILSGDQNPPATEPTIGTLASGFSLNGLTTAVFDGVSTKAQNQYGSLADYIRTWRFWLGMLVYPVTAPPPAVFAYDDPAFFDANSVLVLGISTAGVRANVFDGVHKTSAAVACPLATWSWVEVWLAYQELHISVNGVEGAPLLGVENIEQVASVGPALGANYDDTKWLEGAIAEVMISKQVMPTSVRALIKDSYINPRYNLSL